MDREFQDSETAKSKVINAHFKFLISIIVTLTVVFVIAYLLLCFCVDVPTQLQEDCAGTLETLITFGFGTICGLFSGTKL